MYGSRVVLLFVAVFSLYHLGNCKELHTKGELNKRLFRERRILSFFAQSEVNKILLAEYVQTCYREDPNLNQCLTKEGNRILKQFCKGIPELGIVSTDPFVLGSIDVIPQKSNALYMKQTNAVLKGLRNSKIVELRINPKESTGFFHIIGNITLKSNYVIGGQLLVFPISGKGDSLIKMDDFDVQINWNWDVVIGKDGKEYTRFKNYTSKYDFKDVKFKMNGLFNNDKLLGDTMNRLLNENARDVMADLGDPAVKIVIKRMVKVMNTLFSNVPYETLLPHYSK